MNEEYYQGVQQFHDGRHFHVVKGGPRHGEMVFVPELVNQADVGLQKVERVSGSGLARGEDGLFHLVHPVTKQPYTAHGSRFFAAGDRYMSLRCFDNRSGV